MENDKCRIAHYHLPGLFEFYDLYRKFLAVYENHREYFYEWCDIGSVYGAAAGCLWAGGRVENGEAGEKEVLDLMYEYGISPCLTFSNSLLSEEHLADVQCNKICKMIDKGPVRGGIIVYSDLLLKYLQNTYPNLYFISSTTKVITDFDKLKEELDREDFTLAVPDFRFNRQFDKLELLTVKQKSKVEFLCNECCGFDCKNRKKCYENVSRKNLGLECAEFVCKSPGGEKGYRFSEAMKNPGFIGVEDIRDIYLPMGFTEFKIEGRGLGSALVLEFLLYYLTKPEYQLRVREEIYLDNMLDLF